jgi:hypothetical protein
MLENGLLGSRVVYLILKIMASIMTFNFNENYSIEMNTEDADSLRTKLATILDSVSTVSPSEETQVAYITGERDPTEDANEEMCMDSWFLSVYSLNNERNCLTKTIGDTTTYVRAKNNITGNYEEFTMDVSDAVDVLRDMLTFIQKKKE